MNKDFLTFLHFKEERDEISESIAGQPVFMRVAGLARSMNESELKTGKSLHDDGLVIWTTDSEGRPRYIWSPLAEQLRLMYLL